MKTKIIFIFAIPVIVLLTSCKKEAEPLLYYKECEPLVGWYPLKALWSSNDTTLIWDCDPYKNTWIRLDAIRNLTFHRESVSSTLAWGTSTYVAHAEYTYAIVNDSTIIISGYESILDSIVPIYPHLGTDTSKIMIIDFQRYRFQRYY